MKCGVFLLLWFHVMVSDLLEISNGAISTTHRYTSSCNTPVCYIDYTTTETSIPPVPDYLQDKSATHLCRSRGNNQNKPMIKCESDFIKSKCICSFHLVSNDSNHDYTACLGNSMKDSVNYLTCNDCTIYSVNGTGPCLNGGQITCHQALASDITCSCPPRSSGKYCQIKEVVKLRECCKEATHDSSLPICKDNQDGPCKFNNLTCFSRKTYHEFDTLLESCLSKNTTHQTQVNHLISTGRVCENALSICVLCMIVNFFSIFS